MHTVTVRDLRNQYSALLKWISSGEEVLITRRGRTIARLVPESDPPKASADWSRSPSMTRDRSGERSLSTEESLDLIREAGGKW